MKAVISQRYGTPDVLELKEIERPEIKDDEVMIRVYATSVNTIDIFFRSGMKIFLGLSRLITGVRAPKRRILGFDIAGEIIDTGGDVTGFKVFGGAKSGANAEYAITGDTSITKKASNMSYAEAAVVPMAALSALQGLRDAGKIHEGQEVLIYGASGGIGSYAVQLAKYFGTTATAVASGKNEKLVKNLGADRFIDYTKEDFTVNEDRYDLIFDTVAKSPVSRWKEALKPNGIFVNAGSPSMSLLRFYINRLGSRFRKKKYRSFDTKYLKKDLEFLAKLAEEGHLRSVIDKEYQLSEIREAHRYYELGHTAGKIAVVVRSDESKDD